MDCCESVKEVWWRVSTRSSTSFRRYDFHRASLLSIRTYWVQPPSLDAQFHVILDVVAYGDALPNRRHPFYVFPNKATRLEEGVRVGVLSFT